MWLWKQRWRFIVDLDLLTIRLTFIFLVVLRKLCLVAVKKYLFLYYKCRRNDRKVTHAYGTENTVSSGGDQENIPPIDRRGSWSFREFAVMLVNSYK